jgi:sterol desaturase/sphingolipid hydroxylase (fatty acid hydroxylase superfamily)
MTWRHIAELLFHSRALRSIAGGCLHALKYGVVFYFFVYLLERASGGTTKQYRTRGFLQDVAYWFYYGSGLNNLLFMAALFSFLGSRLTFLQFKMLAGLHPIVRGTLWFLLADFSDYWVHRLQHASRFVWAFHSMHHSQEQLNLFTMARFHPVDYFISNTLTFFPLFMLGASPKSWVPLRLALDLISITLHSRITWRLGAISRVFITPWFHSFHHSADPRHYNKNFGGILIFWDQMFGTAMDAPEQPAEYGLTDVKMPTLISTLWVPFRLLRQLYAKPSSSLYNTRTGFISPGSAEQPPPP